MHFLLFENLVRSPHEELNKVADFLDVPRFEELPQLRSILKPTEYTDKNIANVLIAEHEKQSEEYKNKIPATFEVIAGRSQVI